MKKFYNRRQAEIDEEVEPNGLIGDAKEVMEGMKEAAVQIADASKVIADRLSDHKIDNLLAHADRLVCKANDAVECVEGKIKKFSSPSNLKRLGVIVSMVIGQLFTIGRVSFTFLLLEVIKICACLIPDNMFGKLEELKSFVFNHFSHKTTTPQRSNEAQKNDEVEVNSGESVDNGSLIKTFVYKAVSLVTNTPDKEVEKFGALKVLGEQGKNLNGINMGANVITGWAVKIFDAIHSLIAKIAGNAILPVGECQKFNADYCDLLDRDPEDYGKLQYANKLMEMHKTALSLKRRIENGQLKLDKAARAIVIRNIEKTLTTYKEQRMTVMQTQNSQKMRKTPFFTQLVGLSGSGKSTLMKLLAKVMTKFENCGKDYPEDDLIFNVSGTKYKDMYRMQPVHLHDDQWQSRAGDLGGTNEYHDSIKEISCSHLQVDMASLELKGAPFFCELYIGSTNDAYPTPADIKCHEALWRRRKALVLIESRNWNTTNQIFNVDFGTKYNHLNWVACKFLDPNVKTPWETEAKRVRQLLSSNQQSPDLGDGWVSFDVMAKKMCALYREHLEFSDPKWIDGDDLPSALVRNIPAPPPPVIPAAPAVAFNVADEAVQVNYREGHIGHFEDVRQRYFYGESAQEFLTDYPIFKDDRLDHKRTTFSCYDADCQIEHPQVCCVEFAECMDNSYLSHFCGKTGFYEDSDEIGFFSTPREEEMDEFEIGWYATLVNHGMFDYLDFEDSYEEEFVPNMADDAQQKLDEQKPGPSAPGAEKRDFDEEDKVLFKKLYGMGEPLTPEEKDRALTAMEDGSYVDFLSEIIDELIAGHADQFPKLMSEAKKQLWIRLATMLAACAGAFAVVKLFKFYFLKPRRKKSKVEELSEALSDVLDRLNELEEVPADLEVGVTKLMLRVQQKMVDPNASFYESGVPTKGVKTRFAKMPEIQLVNPNCGTGTLTTLSDRINSMADNFVHFRVHVMVDGVKKTINIAGLGLCGQTVLINMHFLERIPFDFAQREHVMEILRHGVWTHIRVPAERVIPFPDRDLAAMQLPKGQNSFRDIRKYFCDDKDVSTHGGDMLLVGRRINGEMLNCSAPYQMRATPLNYGEGECKKSIVKAWVYNVNLDLNGMCCSPVWDTRTCKIVGLHVANSKVVGGRKFAVPISRNNVDLIATTVEKYNGRWIVDNVAEQAVEQLVVNCADNLRVEGAGSVECFGVVTSKLQENSPGVTKLVKSPIFEDAFENSHGPSVLSMRDKRISEEARQGPSVHQKGVNKFSEPVGQWTGGDRRRASDVFEAVMRTGRHKMEQRLLTDFEMLNGLEDGSLKPIDMDASSGTPWKNMKPSNVRGKLHIFENDEPEGEKKIWKWRDSEVANLVKDSLDKIEDMARNGEAPLWVAYENIKDELRSQEKIENANSRTFDCVPVEVTLLFRKYFGTYIAFCHKNCAQLPISVGIDPHTQWTDIAHRMVKRGDALVAGDYKNWDGSVGAVELMDAIEDVNKFYNDGEENARVREVLIYTATHMVFVSTNGLLRKHQGLPSGIPLTAVLNSHINWRRMLCCVQECWRDAGRESLTVDQLISDTDLVAYGDDHILSMSDELREVVNFRTVRDKFASKNIKYTDSRKLGTDFEFETLAQVSYLKRTFKQYVAGFYLGPLDLKSVERQANWLHKNKVIRGLDMLACVKNSMQEELALHGRGVYESHRAKYNEAVARVRGLYPETLSEPTIVMSYDCAMERVRDKLGLSDFGLLDNQNAGTVNNRSNALRFCSFMD